MNKKQILDAGHFYILESIDGDFYQTIRFVKRHDNDKPWRFPGNTNSYSGTTLQIVIRVLIDRVNYLQNQIPCLENKIIIKLFQLIL